MLPFIEPSIMMSLMPTFLLLPRPRTDIESLSGFCASADTPVMSAESVVSSRLLPERFMLALSHISAEPIPERDAVIVPPSVPYLAACIETFEGKNTIPSSGVRVNVIVLPSTADDGSDEPDTFATFVCILPLSVEPLHTEPPFSLTVNNEPYETVLPAKPTDIVSGEKTGSESTRLYDMFPSMSIVCPPALEAIPCIVMSDMQRYLPDASLLCPLYQG